MSILDYNRPKKVNIDYNILDGIISHETNDGHYSINVTTPSQNIQGSSQPNTEKPMSEIVKLDNGKFKFADGTREYNSKESATNAYKGFMKFKDKRNEATQVVHNQDYEDYTASMTTEEKQKYDTNLKTSLAEQKAKGKAALLGKI